MTFSVSVTPSQTQITLVLLVTALSLSALLLSDLDQWFIVACALAICVSCLHHLFWVAGWHRDSIVQIQLVKGQWWLTMADGRLLRAQLCGPRIVLPWLVSTHFRCGRRELGCTLLRDTMSAKSHRLLRSALLMSEYPSQLSIKRLTEISASILGSTVSRWYQNGVGRLWRS